MDPFNGMHPCQAWISRDSETVRQNAMAQTESPTDGVYFAFSTSRTSGPYQVAANFCADYPVSFKVPVLNEEVREALNDDRWQPLEIPNELARANTWVDLKVWVRIYDYDLQGSPEDQMVLLAHYTFEGDEGAEKLQPVLMKLDPWAVQQFRPRQDPHHKLTFQLVVFNRDGSVGAYTWGDREPLTQLGEVGGKPVVVRSGCPKTIVEWDRRAKGSVDAFRSTGGQRLSFLFMDALNRIQLKADINMAHGSSMVISSIRGQALKDLTTWIRQMRDPPRIQGPDQILDACQISQVHDWWYTQMASLAEDGQRNVTEHEVPLVEQQNFHWVCVGALKVDAARATGQIKAALAAQAAPFAAIPDQAAVGPVRSAIRAPGTNLQRAIEGQPMPVVAVAATMSIEEMRQWFGRFSIKNLITEVNDDDWDWRSEYVKCDGLQVEGDENVLLGPPHEGHTLAVLYLVTETREVPVLPGTELATLVARWARAKVEQVAGNTELIHRQALIREMVESFADLLVKSPTQPKAPPAVVTGNVHRMD